jgi:hypothetical protein
MFSGTRPILRPAGSVELTVAVVPLLIGWVIRPSRLAKPA